MSTEYGPDRAAIENSLANTNYGHTLAARGITTVALDSDGQIVEYRPDRTTTVLPTPR